MGKEKAKKRKLSTTSEDSDSSSSSDSSVEQKKLRKLKKKLKKEKKKSDKVLKKKMKSKKRKSRDRRRSESESCSRDEAGTADDSTADIPIELMERSRAMAPMTKEEWERKQSVVRRVLDEETGRERLIKGDGEVIEEIVSRDRHKQINRRATAADGAFFQANTVANKHLRL